jgi:hypothetical protein
VLRLSNHGLLFLVRVCDESTAVTVGGGGEACRGVLAEQREVGGVAAGRDGERAGGIGAAGGLRPADGRMVGKHDAGQIEQIGRGAERSYRRRVGRPCISRFQARNVRRS